MKPFGGKSTSPEAEYFEKRASKARKTVECAFDIIFYKAIETKESTAETNIKTICVLHNTIIDMECFRLHLKELVEIQPTANLEDHPTERLTDSSKHL